MLIKVGVLLLGTRVGEMRNNAMEMVKEGVGVLKAEILVSVVRGNGTRIRIGTGIGIEMGTGDHHLAGEGQGVIRDLLSKLFAHIIQMGGAI